jgi:hypothetical protein
MFHRITLTHSAVEVEDFFGEGFSSTRNSSEHLCLSSKSGT